jgi:hypothetical protein
VGFLRRLFGLEGSDSTKSSDFEHPVLGRLSRTWDFSWVAAQVEMIGCCGTPSLSIAGEESGPNPECISTYLRMRNEWDSIKVLVGAEIFVLNQNYFSEEPNCALPSANAAWDTVELLGIDVYGEGNFSFTCRFDWQYPGDGHETTIYFENWKPAGFAHDG